MSYTRYLLFDIAGGFLWVWSMILLGYTLGSTVPNIDKRIHYVIAVVILFFASPPPSTPHGKHAPARPPPDRSKPRPITMRRFAEAYGRVGGLQGSKSQKSR